MRFRTETGLRNPSETAQRLSLAGAFRGFGGFGVSKEEGREIGRTLSRPLYLPGLLEGFRPAPKPRNAETLARKPCAQQGSSGFDAARSVRNLGLLAAIEVRLAAATARPERSWAELEGLSAYQPQHTEKGRSSARQTFSFNAEVHQCL